MLKMAMSPRMEKKRQETFLFQVCRNVKSHFVVQEEKLFFQFFCYRRYWVVCCVLMLRSVTATRVLKLGSFAHKHTVGICSFANFLLRREPHRCMCKDSVHRNLCRSSQNSMTFHFCRYWEPRWIKMWSRQPRPSAAPGTITTPLRLFYTHSRVSPRFIRLLMLLRGSALQSW